MKDVADFVLVVALVFGPILGYIPQYQEIKRSNNPDCFSTLVCFILLCSNILRIFFWIGKRFEFALLLQSIVMVAAQVILLELIVRLRVLRTGDINLNYQIPSYVNYGRFWNWDFFGEYLAFLLTLVASLGVITIFNILAFKSQALTEFTGTVALMLESTLAMPQVYNNYINKSTAGLRLELILSWFGGDAFKTFFFLYRQAPIQFVICGLVQLLVDCIILVQVYIYGRQTPKRTNYKAK